MADQKELAEAFFECISPENRDKLDKKVDDLGQIANSMDEWEGPVAECLGLTKVDCANIQSQHRDNLGLQTRAALQKWKEKNGFRFLNLWKTSCAEAVCKVLDGDPSMIRVPPPKMMPYATMPAVGSTGGASKKTRLRTNQDYHNLYSFLGPHAAQWRAIGTALGFFSNELNIIQSNVMLSTQGPSGYLGDMLTKWLQWAPGDGRGSKDFATFEDLRDALLKANLGPVAYDLGAALDSDPTSPGGASINEDEMSAQFMAKLKDWKITIKDQDELKENGITSDEAWSMMTAEDLKELSLTIGGRKILKKHLPVTKPPPCPPPPQRSFSREVSLDTADTFCPEFLKILEQKTISKKDIKILQEHGITTWEVFKDLTSENLKEMKMSMGGRLILVQCLSSQQESQQASSKQSTVPQQPEQPQADTYKISEGRDDQDYDPSKAKLIFNSTSMRIPVPVPMDVPEHWKPCRTEPESDGSPDSRQSYVPYAREFTSKTDRTMKHKPRLKLDENDKILTTLDTHPVQLPSSLVGNYEMKRRSLKKGHGLCLVLNNENFTDETRHKKREGTNRDEYNLVETFRFLGYRVEIRRDCKSHDIRKLFDDIGSFIEPEDDSFICCILSHGSNNIMYGSDSEGVALRTNEDSLEMKLTRCAKLENKPKLFFVSTCRKSKQKPKPDGEDTHEPEPDSDQNPRADFAFNFATLPGEASWRYTDTGTFYINNLCQMLCKYATKANLSDIQKMVAQKVCKMEKHQMPTLEEQTTQNVYFFDDFFEAPQ